jgi:hypothetical protein
MIGEVKIVLISGLVLELGMIETVKLIRIMTLSNLINEVSEKIHVIKWKHRAELDNNTSSGSVELILVQLQLG